MHKSEARILLVEDNPTLQLVFERQMRRLGYSVADFVSNGLIAVRRAMDDHFHVIFMDVRLPGIDGIAATKQIRTAQSRNGRRSVIIGLTAFSEYENCIKAGMDDFLQKPVLLEQLDEVLQKWVLEANSSVIAIEPVQAMERPVHSRNTDTATRLKLIQDKIANLRASVGLD